MYGGQRTSFTSTTSPGLNIGNFRSSRAFSYASCSSVCRAPVAVSAVTLLGRGALFKATLTKLAVSLW